jgi:deoxyadenosine/deoxycytidine kinase
MSRIEISKNFIRNGFIVEVCGGIAAGKTTFASLMKRLDLEPIFEDFKKSPFWKAFYCNPGKYIFETEASFILLHYHQIKKALDSTKGDKVICDFSFLLDLAYAKMGLTDTKLKAFECVLDEIKEDIITIDSAKKDFANVELVKKEMISLINDLLSQSLTSIPCKL